MKKQVFMYLFSFPLQHDRTIDVPRRCRSPPHFYRGHEMRDIHDFIDFQIKVRVYLGGWNDEDIQWPSMRELIDGLKPEVKQRKTYKTLIRHYEELLTLCGHGHEAELAFAAVTFLDDILLETRTKHEHLSRNQLYLRVAHALKISKRTVMNKTKDIRQYLP